MSSIQTLPVIADVEITVDAEGRYNLNALHKASGTDANNAPAQWMRTQQAQDFVSEVQKQTVQICIVSKEGRNGGTFAHELIAVEYAGWISPAFRIKVNQTFIDYRTGKLNTPPASKYPPIKLIGDTFATCHKIARLCGLKGNHAALSADRGTKDILGISALALIGAELTADPRGMTYTPTELGKMLTPPVSARAMNLLLERAGLQKKELEHWLPTDAAIGLFEWVDTGKKHSSGVPVKQIRWFESAIRQLPSERQAA